MRCNLVWEILEQDLTKTLEDGKLMLCICLTFPNKSASCGLPIKDLLSKALSAMYHKINPHMTSQGARCHPLGSFQTGFEILNVFMVEFFVTLFTTECLKTSYI